MRTLNCTCFRMKTNQEMLLTDPIEMWFSFARCFIWLLLLCKWTVSDARSDVNDKNICCAGCWLFGDDDSKHAHAHSLSPYFISKYRIESSTIKQPAFNTFIGHRATECFFVYLFLLIGRERCQMPDAIRCWPSFILHFCTSSFNAKHETKKEPYFHMKLPLYFAFFDIFHYRVSRIAHAPCTK